MVMRVATFALSGSMIESALRTQAEIATRQIQESSGKVSADYGGLGAKSKQVIDLQVSVARSSNYEDAATSADNRVEAMYSATGSVADLLSNFKAELTSASGASADTSSLTTIAQGDMEDLASLLNTLTINTTANVTQVALVLPEAQLEQLVNMVQQHHHAENRPPRMN